MIQKEKVDLDYAKLKPEDRRFLMQRSAFIAATDSTNKLANTSILIAFISAYAAVFSILYSLEGTFSSLVAVVAIIGGIFVIVLLIIYFSSQEKVQQQLKQASEGHNTIFKRHFEYARKR